MDNALYGDAQSRTWQLIHAARWDGRDRRIPDTLPDDLPAPDAPEPMENDDA